MTCWPAVWFPCIYLSPGPASSWFTSPYNSLLVSIKFLSIWHLKSQIYPSEVSKNQAEIRTHEWILGLILFPVFTYSRFRCCFSTLNMQDRTFLVYCLQLYTIAILVMSQCPFAICMMDIEEAWTLTICSQLHFISEIKSN